MLALIKDFHFDFNFYLFLTAGHKLLLIDDDIELSFEVVFNLNYFGGSHCTRAYYLKRFDWRGPQSKAINFSGEEKNNFCQMRNWQRNWLKMKIWNKIYDDDYWQRTSPRNKTIRVNNYHSVVPPNAVSQFVVLLGARKFVLVTITAPIWNNVELTYSGYLRLHIKLLDRTLSPPPLPPDEKLREVKHYRKNQR